MNFVTQCCQYNFDIFGSSSSVVFLFSLFIPKTSLFITSGSYVFISVYLFVCHHIHMRVGPVS